MGIFFKGPDEIFTISWYSKNELKVWLINVWYPLPGFQIYQLWRGLLDSRWFLHPGRQVHEGPVLAWAQVGSVAVHHVTIVANLHRKLKWIWTQEDGLYDLQWIIWSYADPLNFTCLPLEYSILVSNFIILLLALRSDAHSSSHVYKLFLYNATLWISLFSFNISKCNLNNLQICSEPTYGRFS